MRQVLSHCTARWRGQVSPLGTLRQPVCHRIPQPVGSVDEPLGDVSSLSVCHVNKVGSFGGHPRVQPRKLAGPIDHVVSSVFVFGSKTDLSWLPYPVKRSSSLSFARCPLRHVSHTVSLVDATLAASSPTAAASPTIAASPVAASSGVVTSATRTCAALLRTATVDEELLVAFRVQERLQNGAYS